MSSTADTSRTHIRAQHPDAAAGDLHTPGQPLYPVIPADPAMWAANPKCGRCGSRLQDHRWQIVNPQNDAYADQDGVVDCALR